MTLTYAARPMLGPEKSFFSSSSSFQKHTQTHSTSFFLLKRSAQKWNVKSSWFQQFISFDFFHFHSPKTSLFFNVFRFLLAHSHFTHSTYIYFSRSILAFVLFWFRFFRLSDLFENSRADILRDFHWRGELFWQKADKDSERNEGSSKFNFAQLQMKNKS